jgi:hypothetical protein
MQWSPMRAMCVVRIYLYIIWSQMGAGSVIKSNTHVYVMVPNGSHVYGEIKSVMKLYTLMYDTVPTGKHGSHWVPLHV